LCQSHKTFVKSCLSVIDNMEGRKQDAIQIEKALRVSIEWAAKEFQHTIAKAEKEASNLIIRANLVHEVAMEKNRQAWECLRLAEAEADDIVEQAIEDADYIVDMARETAQSIKATAKMEFDNMVDMFRTKLNLLLVECSNKAHTINGTQ
jgi:vacuolar-type H+-ATPase subunit H